MMVVCARGGGGHNEKKYSVTHCNNLYASNQNTRTVAGRTSTKLTQITTRTTSTTATTQGMNEKSLYSFFRSFSFINWTFSFTLYISFFSFLLFLVSWAFFQFTLNNYIVDLPCFWMWIRPPPRAIGMRVGPNVISAKGLLVRRSFSIRQIVENPKNKQWLEGKGKWQYK